MWQGPHPPKPLSKEQTEALGLKGPQFAASGKPTLRIEITTVDTGERKEFFGHTAKAYHCNKKNRFLSRVQNPMLSKW